jgi:hypothetical protein
MVRGIYVNLARRRESLLVCRRQGSRVSTAAFGRCLGSEGEPSSARPKKC